MSATTPPSFAASPPPFPDVTTKAVDAITDDGSDAFLIGGLVSAVLVLLIVIIAVLLWCLSRHKGSYATNEMDDEDEDEDEDNDESVASDTALQSREPLKVKEDE